MPVSADVAGSSKFKNLQLPEADLNKYVEYDDPATTATAQVPEKNEIISPAHLAHVVLQTNRLEEMRRWWRTVLGAEPMFSSKDYEFMTFDDEHHRIGLFDRGPITDKDPDKPTPGLHHMAFTYTNLADLVSTYRRLQVEDISPIRSLHHGTSVSNYYVDPDGNRVELQIDPFPTVGELNTWLSQRGFNRNPIGILFEFEDMAAAFEAGEDVWELVHPDTMGVGQDGADT